MIECKSEHDSSSVTDPTIGLFFIEDAHFFIQDRLQQEKGITLDSPLLPLSILRPGVPQTGRLMNGKLILPSDHGNHSNEN